MDIKELKRLIELFNNGGDLSDYAKAKLLTFIDEQQALQLIQTDVIQRSELLTFLEEVASEDRMMSSGRIRERAVELLKVNCG